MDIKIEDFLDTPADLETEIKRVFSGSFGHNNRSAMDATVDLQPVVRSFLQWTPVYYFTVNLESMTVDALAERFQKAVKAPRPPRLHCRGRSLRSGEITLREAGLTAGCSVQAFVKS